MAGQGSACNEWSGPYQRYVRLRTQFKCRSRRPKGSLEDAFGTASFREISVHTVPTRRRFPSLAEAMRYARGPLPLRELMARLSRAEQEQAWAEIERALARFAGPQGYDSPCELLIGVGTK